LKLVAVALLIIASTCSTFAQQPATNQKPATAESAASTAGPTARPGDVDSVEHIVAAIYDVISGPTGTRDWNRLRSLFHPEARLISSGRRDGKIMARVRTVDEYIKTTSEIFAKEGFFERGIHNDVQQFDHIAQVWSTYESRHNKDDVKPFVRGINSFQLLYDGSRWWVVNVYWQNEDASNPIPAKYLP
jgi:hypothetical protein